MRIFLDLSQSDDLHDDLNLLREAYRDLESAENNHAALHILTGIFDALCDASNDALMGSVKNKNTGT